MKDTSGIILHEYEKDLIKLKEFQEVLKRLTIDLLSNCDVVPHQITCRVKDKISLLKYPSGEVPYSKK